MRKEALLKRDGLDPLERIELSLAARDYGAKALHFDPGTAVSGFWPIRSEIDPRPLMSVFGKKGARLCLPVVMDRATIIFRELTAESELVETGFGTVGPGIDAEVLEPEIILVPLSAFDRQGGRLGYGAGFYDRAIAKLHLKGIHPLLAGFAFACQEVEKVPMEDHDQRLAMIITDAGVVYVDKPVGKETK